MWVASDCLQWFAGAPQALPITALARRSSAQQMAIRVPVVRKASGTTARAIPEMERERWDS